MPNQVTASDLPFYKTFGPQKVSLLKISDDVIACDLWFGLPPIKNPGYVYGYVVPHFGLHYALIHRKSPGIVTTTFSCMPNSGNIP